jgi:hypothetical protein
MPAAIHRRAPDTTYVAELRATFIGQLKLLIARFDMGVPLSPQSLRGFARVALQLAEELE